MIKHTGSDDLIAKYLDGLLSPEARLEFERLMREDSILAREVRAEGLIRSALLSDGVRLPDGAAEPSPAILKKLSATSGSGVAGSAASQAVAGGAAQSVLGAIFGTTLGITIISVVGIAGLVLGVFLVAPIFREPGKSGRVERVEPASALPAAVPAGEANRPATTTPGVTGVRETGGQTPEVRKNTDVGDSIPRVDRDGRAASPSTSTRDVGGSELRENKSAEGTTEADEMMRYLQRQRDVETPRVIRKDSVKLKLEVEE